MHQCVLLIDDDLNLAKVLAYQLSQKGYSVTVAHNGLDGLNIFSNQKFDIILSDVQLPDSNGLELLHRIREKDRDVIFILITAYGTVENAIDACRKGANDYLTKPFGKEQLFFAIEKAQNLKNLQNENQRLRSVLDNRHNFENIVAHSSIMRELLNTAVQIAQSDATVLIYGESGTGKELIAKGIHFNSMRKDQPFIVVNCPSVPANLLESELFGYEKGAFTGATRQHTGKFERASTGTIFLDEIGDLHLDLQAKLLRVLQEQEVERIGSKNPIKIDVRVLAATNQKLENLVGQRKFREDLFYRLNVVPLVIPPLRERREDIPFLIDHFLQKSEKLNVITIQPNALDKLMNYSWPGNIRELQNFMERLTVLSRKNKIGADDLPQEILQENNSLKSDTENSQGLEDFERRLIISTLNKVNGNRSKAARLLKIPRHVLLYRLKKYRIE